MFDYWSAFEDTFKPESLGPFLHSFPSITTSGEKPDDTFYSTRKPWVRPEVFHPGPEPQKYVFEISAQDFLPKIMIYEKS